MDKLQHTAKTRADSLLKLSKLLRTQATDSTLSPEAHARMLEMAADVVEWAIEGGLQDAAHALGLVPERVGQPRMMTIIDGAHADEAGHWYSPAAVRDMLSEERKQTCASVKAADSEARVALALVAGLDLQGAIYAATGHGAAFDAAINAVHEALMPDGLVAGHGTQDQASAAFETWWCK